MTGNTHTTSKQLNDTMRPSYINYCLKTEVPKMLHYQLCSTGYKAIKFNKCLKRTSAIKVVTMNYRWFPLWIEAIMCLYTTKSTLFAVSKDKWQGNGKSIRNALYVQQYGKRYLSGWSNVKKRKKIKPVALGIVELC